MADLTPVTLRDPSSPLPAVYVPGAGMIATSLSDGRYRTARAAPRLAAYPGWRAQQVSDQKLTAELDFGAQEELRASFPFPHLVELTIELSDRTLTVSTTVTPTTDKAVPLVYGYHPYLQLPDVPRPQWQIELPTMRHVILDDTGIPTGATAERPADRRAVGRHGVRRWLRPGRRRGGVRGLRRRTPTGGAIRAGLPGRASVRARRRNGRLLRTDGRAHRRIEARQLPVRPAG